MGLSKSSIFKKNLFSGSFVLFAGGFILVLSLNSEQRNPAQFSDVELQYAEILLDEESNKATEESSIDSQSFVWREPSLQNEEQQEKTIEEDLDDQIQKEYHENLKKI